ncbi:pyridoxamine 5'-phosphate oxidase family protein [Mariniflexile sp.]|uniref:pyridoxamine 5'-phosphate oxidase family protein n=1 Tax=Mariniflexile sp. TaxID=1979402 RepID=UPI004048C4BC
MSNKNDTKDKNGVKKLKALIDGPKVVMMATRLDKIPFSVCPMTLQQVDEQGDIWFFSSKDSSHFEDITFDNRVQIIYLDDDNQIYISIFGNATHVEDDKKTDELWSPMLNNWYNGKDDPNLVLLSLNVENAYYWDSEENKLVSFFKMIGGAISDGTSGFGNKGEINLQNY